jgi:hypothetical protein
LLLIGGVFDETEAQAAVARRAERRGVKRSAHQALEIAKALGCDPLLIALAVGEEQQAPEAVIGAYVARALERSAASVGNVVDAQFLAALRSLAAEMLRRRNLAPTLGEIASWPALDKTMNLIATLAIREEVIRTTGAAVDRSLAFRHDRVRDWVLADAIMDLEAKNELEDELISEPHYAEVLGAVLANGKASGGFLDRLASLNPLALFQALRLSGTPSTPLPADILARADAWLTKTAGIADTYIGREAARALSSTDGLEVASLAQRFSSRDDAAQLARLRNGDINGAVAFCSQFEPGVGAPWRDLQIDHAKLHHGQRLRQGAGAYLCQPQLNQPSRSGALRFAGHLADASLGPAIETCWQNDPNPADLLDDYMWAFAQCCGDTPARYLDLVMDAWKQLPDESEKEHSISPRFAIIEHQLRWAFHRWPPDRALHYFVKRMQTDADLRYPLFYMLHGIDRPEAVVAVVCRYAERRRADSHPAGFMGSDDEWRRRQSDGRAMSDASRDALRALWQDQTHDKALRVQAFRFWDATKYDADLRVLREAELDADMGDELVRARLLRGDTTAIPALIERLHRGDGDRWWWWARSVWSPELAHELDRWLQARCETISGEVGGSTDADYAVSELLMKIPPIEAETILLGHWAYLRSIRHYVLAALCAGTPALLEAAARAVAACAVPPTLFRNMPMRYGVRTQGREGITRQSQIKALQPYMKHLPAGDIAILWDLCNDRGWYALRKEVLDPGLSDEAAAARKWSPESERAELDKTLATAFGSWNVRFWVEHALKTNATWEEISAVLFEWLASHRTIEALEVASAAMRDFGSRGDIARLAQYSDLGDKTRVLIDDASYAIRRRTLLD